MQLSDIIPNPNLTSEEKYWWAVNVLSFDNMPSNVVTYFTELRDNNIPS